MQNSDICPKYGDISNFAMILRGSWLFSSCDLNESVGMEWDLKFRETNLWKSLSSKSSPHSKRYLDEMDVEGHDSDLGGAHQEAAQPQMEIR